MAKRKHNKPAVQAKGVSPISGTAPPAEHQFPPGVSGNPAGRPKNAGSSILEWVNALAESTMAQVKQALDDETAPMAKRIAAGRVLCAVAEGEDFDRLCDRTLGKPVQGVKDETPPENQARRIVVMRTAPPPPAKEG